MSPRGTRRKIDTGIYSDDIGFSLCAKIHGTQFEKRTKAQPDQALRQRWIEELTEKMPPATTGTLAGDIAEYLTTLPPKSRRKQNAELDLQPWLDRCGECTRKELTAVEIRAALASWQAEGFAPSTINHRRQELSNVFTTLNGRSGANPVRDVPRLVERYDEPRGFPMEIVQLILDQIPAGPEKCRLTVMATTGLPPAQIARLEPHDFHAATQALYVRPRRKGAGVPGRTLPLTTAAVRALQGYFSSNAKGPSYSRTLKMFHKAVTIAKKKWLKANRGKAWPAPKNLRPYDLRHAWLTHAYRTTKDLRAVAELGLHSDLKTTRRYAEAAVSDTARHAIRLLDAGAPSGTARKQAKKRRTA